MRFIETLILFLLTGCGYPVVEQPNRMVVARGRGVANDTLQLYASTPFLYDAARYAAAEWNAAIGKEVVEVALYPKDYCPDWGRGFVCSTDKRDQADIHESVAEALTTFTPDGYIAGCDIRLFTDVFLFWDVAGRDIGNNNGYAFDVRAVVLHEMGHCLGLNHLPIENTVMNQYIAGYGISRLTDADIAAVRAIYQ